MSQIHQLFQLQKIDSEIMEKKKRLGAVLKAQKGNATLNALRTQASAAAAQLKQNQAQHNDLSLELEGLSDKLKTEEKRLYSGKVVNPKELTDLQQEVESLGRRKTTLEEQSLEAMLAVEGAEKEKTAVDAQLEKLEAAWEVETADLKKEQNELALRLHHLMQKRQQHAATIDSDKLKIYESLSKSKNGVAVAKIRVDQCLSCQISLPANKVKLAKGGQIVFCGGCGRIVYVV